MLIPKAGVARGAMRGEIVGLQAYLANVRPSRVCVLQQKRLFQSITLHAVFESVLNMEILSDWLVCLKCCCDAALAIRTVLYNDVCNTQKCYRFLNLSPGVKGEA